MFTKIQILFLPLIILTLALLPVDTASAAYTTEEAIQYACRDATGGAKNSCISNYESNGLPYTRISEYCVFKEGDNAGYDQCFRELGGSEAQNSESSADTGSSNTPSEGTRDEINKNQCKSETLEANDDCLILKYTVTAINVLSALAGMAIIGAMIFAGYLYMTARDNAGQIQQAKQRIIWALIALVVFVFTYVILDFLVPGGVI